MELRNVCSISIRAVQIDDGVGTEDMMRDDVRVKVKLLAGGWLDLLPEVFQRKTKRPRLV